MLMHNWVWVGDTEIGWIGNNEPTDANKKLRDILQGADARDPVRLRVHMLKFDVGK